MPRGPEGFVGIVGGDDYVPSSAPTSPTTARPICQRFDALVTRLYEPEDLERGFIRMEDRKGDMQDIPLVGVSVGVASRARRTFAHYAEVVAVATQMKQFAKRERRSSFAMDRRTETNRPADTLTRPSLVYWPER